MPPKLATSLIHTKIGQQRDVEQHKSGKRLAFGIFSVTKSCDYFAWWCYHFVALELQVHSGLFQLSCPPFIISHLLQTTIQNRQHLATRHLTQIEAMIASTVFPHHPRQKAISKVIITSMDDGLLCRIVPMHSLNNYWAH
jgi:hypothetical protein